MLMLYGILTLPEVLKSQQGRSEEKEGEEQEQDSKKLAWFLMGLYEQARALCIPFW